MSTTANNSNLPASKGDEARLAELLGAYGRNPLRWPEADRQRFAGLVRAPNLLPGEAASQAAAIDRLLDMAGPANVAEPAGARARLMQRFAAEPQLVNGVTALPPLGGVRGILAAGMLAASIALGVFIGVGTEAGTTLADSFQVHDSDSDVLELVFADPAEFDDGGVL